jgi:glycerophosphoryl diester phosphodiesterase
VHSSLVSREVVDELRRRVDVVMTWPVNDDQALDQVIAAGVNGVISDELDVLRTVVSRRR